MRLGSCLLLLRLAPALASSAGDDGASAAVSTLEAQRAQLWRALQENEVNLRLAKAAALPSEGKQMPPPGPYQKTCEGCVMFGDALRCDACQAGQGKTVPASISPAHSCDTPWNITNENGFLTCDWRARPPPRVGNLTWQSNGKLPDIDQTCRLLVDTTFVAPQFRMRGDPFEVHPVAPVPPPDGRRFPVNVEACCALCTNSSKCKAWTIAKDGSCQLASSTSTAYPQAGAYSGFPLKSDPAGYCQMLWVNGNGRKWGDQHTASGVACAQLPANGSDAAVGSFPRKWADVKNRDRGTAWFFYPTNDPAANCSCTCQKTGSYMSDYLCQDMLCTGPEMALSLQSEMIKGKPWIVYIHGGEWAECTNINEYYAMFASRVAKASGMGVLAVDFRNLQDTHAVGFPDSNDDVVQALAWLKSKGATELYLVGDSSGATQVVQNLMLLKPQQTHKSRDSDSLIDDGLSRVVARAREANVTVQGGVGFSPWLDMTGSSPTYDSLQTCTQQCSGIGTQIYRASPAGSRIDGQCSAIPYAKGLPLGHPVISPALAPREYLTGMAPLMLIVGGNEMLIGDNMRFASNAQAAGAPVELHVYEGMWHDFIQYTGGQIHRSSYHSSATSCTRRYCPADFSTLVLTKMG
eukprot:SAG31_NODE_333_length_17527_cov_6.972056_13_plen_635_part_00